MIEIYEGRIGGGKTYNAVARIASHLASGGTICTNIRLLLPGLAAFVSEAYGVEMEDDQVWCLSNEQIVRFHECVPWGSLRGSEEKLRVLVVVDEAHLYFNAREWNQTSKQLLAFLTQSDKVSVDVIFISQSALNIDKQFMRLVQYIWRFRDLEKWVIPGLGVRYPFKQILSVQYDYDGSTMLNRWFRTKDVRIFRCYETAALLTDFPDTAGRVHSRKLKKAPRKKMARFLLPLALVVGIVCAFGLYNKLHAGFAPAAPATAQSPQPGQSSGGFLGGVTATNDAKKKAAYDLYTERFRGWYGPTHTLRTDTGWYVAGEMSSKGMVEAVSDRRVKIAQPDGRTGWVIAEDMPLIREGDTTEKLGTNTKPDNCCPDNSPPASSPATVQQTPAMAKYRATRGLPAQATASAGEPGEYDDTAANVQAGLGRTPADTEANLRRQAGLPPLRHAK